MFKNYNYRLIFSSILQVTSYLNNLFVYTSLINSKMNRNENWKIQVYTITYHLSFHKNENENFFAASASPWIIIPALFWNGTTSCYTYILTKAKGKKRPLSKVSRLRNNWCFFIPSVLNIRLSSVHCVK